MAVTKVTEKWVKKQVTLKLKEMGAYYFFPVASGFMSSGVPDIVACWKGNFLGIECKANGNRPTALQIKNLVDIEITIPATISFTYLFIAGLGALIFGNVVIFDVKLLFIFNYVNLER